MRLINRSGISIKPKAPFHEWLLAGSEEPVPSLEELRSESNLYLFDEVDSEEDFVSEIEQYWLTMFENELAAWDEFQDFWPKPLSLDLFMSWFDIDLQLMSFDLSDQPLMRANLDIE